MHGGKGNGIIEIFFEIAETQQNGQNISKMLVTSPTLLPLGFNKIRDTQKANLCRY
jgi:hypothetical protein